MQKNTKKRISLSTLQLKSEERQHMISEIQNFYKKERGEELGLIGAEVILDFFLDGLGSLIYNKALDDSKQWFAKVVNDMEYEYDQLRRE